MIKIDKGIPIPPRNRYPFAEMSIGDSFFTADTKGNISALCWAYSKRHGGKFSMRATVEDGVTGYRVWRIE